MSEGNSKYEKIKTTVSVFELNKQEQELSKNKKKNTKRGVKLVEESTIVY